MAARSVRCILKNQSTTHDLRLFEASLDHGVWSDGPPPNVVARGTEQHFGSESDGFMTGTAGHAVYAVGDSGALLNISWSNPFAGANLFQQFLTNAGSGAGLPSYLDYDPMKPDPPAHPYSRRDDAIHHLEHDDDVVVTYLVREGDDAAVRAPTQTLATQGSALPIAATPDVTTPASPPSPFRRVVYLGLNRNSSIDECRGLRDQVDGQGVFLHMDAVQQHGLLNDDAYARQTSRLDPARERLRALEHAKDPLIYSNEGVAFNNNHRVLVIRALAAELANLDPDFNPAADAFGMKRLVISGHHFETWTRGRSDVIWGSPGNAPDCVLTLFDDLNQHGILAGLGAVFPKAFLQVEDLMLSACFTGLLPDTRKPSPIPPGMFALFKNLKTIWCYETESPGPSATMPERSSRRSICVWEKASRASGASDAIDTASRALRAKFRGRGWTKWDYPVGQSVVWIGGSVSSVDDL